MISSVIKIDNWCLERQFNSPTLKKENKILKISITSGSPLGPTISSFTLGISLHVFQLDSRVGACSRLNAQPKKQCGKQPSRKS